MIQSWIVQKEIYYVRFKVNCQLVRRRKATSLKLIFYITDVMIHFDQSQSTNRSLTWKLFFDRCYPGFILRRGSFHFMSSILRCRLVFQEIRKFRFCYCKYLFITLFMLKINVQFSLISIMFLLMGKLVPYCKISLF